MNYSDEGTVFRLHVLEKITNNFSDEVVGRGAYGEVYKAVYNGEEIAVKKLHPLQGLNDEPFDNEGGSLDKHIADDLCDLDWPICYKIIRDLGLSRIVATTKTHHTERLTLQGTFGYMPPEYVEHSDISKKFDVFSLGSIIVRMMDGNKCHSRFSEMGAQQFIKHVIEKWERRLPGMSGIESHEKDKLQLKKCLEIALQCVERERSKRPSIKDIVHKLEELEAEVSKMSLHSDQSSKRTIDQRRSDTRVVAVDPMELRFLFKPREDISTCLQLTNLSDGFIAFNMKTNPTKYYTKPNKGVIEPCSKCLISVTLKAQKEAPLNMQCNDILVVESANVSEVFTSDEITEGFFEGQAMAGKVVEMPIVYVATD
ncbi:unnamed protein product [Urochloa humidicola]